MLFLPLTTTLREAQRVAEEAGGKGEGENYNNYTGELPDAACRR